MDTVTVVTTIPGSMEPSVSFTTTTTHVWTNILATPGETITVGQSPTYAAPISENTPTFPPIQTFTVTEYDIWVLGPKGNAWTELVIDTSPTDLSTFNPPYPPGQRIFVVPYPCSGWSCWTTGHKVGLVIGAVFGVLFLLLLLCCVRRWRKRKIWVSHGAHGTNDYERWQNSHPGWGYYGPPPANLHTGWGLRPYVTPAQAEAALRGGGPAPAPTPAGGEAKQEGKKEPAKKGTRQKLGAWIAR